MRRHLLASTAAFLLAAPAAWSLEPTQVWITLVSSIERHGGTVGKVVDDGGTITANDIVMAYPNGASATIPALQLAAEGDAVVATMPAPMAYTDGEGTDATIDATALAITVSPQASMGFFGPIGVTATGSLVATVTEPGQAERARTTDIAVEGLDLVVGAGDGAGGANATLAIATLRVDHTDPLTEDTQNVVGFTQDGIAAEITATDVVRLLLGDPVAAVAQGTDVSLAITHGTGTSTSDTPAESATQTWKAGEASLSIDRSGIAYASRATGMEIAAILPGLGNATASMPEARFDGAFPLFAGDAAQEARLTWSIPEVVLGTPDGMTAIAGVVAEPFALSGDVRAQVRLLEDLWPASQTAGPVDPDRALLLEGMSLTGVGLSGIGGAITLDGAATFTDTPTGEPVPTSLAGTAVVEGAGAVFAALETAGLMDAGQRGMVEAMLQAYAAPGATDPLSYAIEMAPTGGFTINGQPM